MSIVKDTLIEELKHIKQQSVRFAHEKNNAKTEYKRQYFTKKLVKNNNKIFQILQAIETLDKRNVDNQ